jgi:Tfp pilus assembly protein PilE
MKVSKTAIFLFELMVVILIFSVAAAVCTSIFGKAYVFSAESKALTMAVLKAESIAEEFKVGKTPDGDMYFDGDWKPAADEAGAAYAVRTSTNDGVLRVMYISVGILGDPGAPEDIVYELQVKTYGK